MFGGAGLALVAWLWGFLGNARAMAISAFVCGFIALVAGIVLSALFQTSSPLGIKIAAVGFAIAAIPSAIGSFFFGLSDSSLGVFFWPGGVIMLIGILVHWRSVVQGSGEDS